MSLRLRLWLAVVTWEALICQVKAAEISSANISLDPAYGMAGCAIVTELYAGTDRQLFIAPQDAYYRVKDYSEAYQPYWFITVEAFDPNTPLFNQALAVSNVWSYGAPRQVWLNAGSRVYIWSGWTGGYANERLSKRQLLQDSHRGIVSEDLHSCSANQFEHRTGGQFTPGTTMAAQLPTTNMRSMMRKKRSMFFQP